MYKFKNDRFQKNRGGTSRVLDVMCEHCGSHIAYYQKDGPGVLKRMYLDRFIDIKPVGDELICVNCKHQLGTLINYKKENRPAYRLFVGSVVKKITSQKNISV